MELRKENVIYLNICHCCGKHLNDDWNVCPYCKSPIKTTKCYKCGKDIKYNWNYCPYCKSDIKAEVNNNLRIEKCNDWLRNILK